MNTAYLVLAHHQPKLLHRLISKPPQTDPVWVHLDAKAGAQDFLWIAEAFPGRVQFTTNRAAAVWGSFSLVQATLNLIEAAGPDFDYYVLLSGQDYPIAPAERIKAFLAAGNGQSFIDFDPLPSKKMSERQDGLYRINRYHYFSKKEHQEFPPYSRKKILNPLFNGIAGLYARYVRPLPLQMKPYWGSQWWMLHNKAIRHISNMVGNPEIIPFFQHTWIPDELFFQTLLLHGDEALRQSLVNDNRRLIKWPAEKDKFGFMLHPLTFKVEDWSMIAASNLLFARKFDEQASAGLLNQIDRHIHNPQAISGTGS